MNELPDFFWAEKLTPLAYYGHPSTVKDPFVEIRLYDEPLDEEAVSRFNDLKKKCLSMELRTKTGVFLKDIWDNKIVIECLTDEGAKVYVGYNNGTYSLGLGIKAREWVKGWPYRQAVVIE